MEEKVWVISKKGDKISSIIWPAGLTIACVILYVYLTGPGFLDTIDLYFYLSAMIVYLILFLILKYTGNWKNPKIIKIDGNKIITEEKFPSGKIDRYEIPIEGIYRITIKRRETLIEYRKEDGSEYIWRLIRPGYAKEDREKLKEVLNEILKRVNKKDVEIIGKG